ncbi:MAG: primosomal protein N' [Calditrichaeota bacterium]|nr:primosomal protein N' [Calditrichota bacterium]
MAKFAEIAVPIPVFQIYTYEIPEIFQEVIVPGSRVLVPLGKRKMTGYVIATKEECNISNLKLIHDLLDPAPVISAELIRLAQWISEYYLCPLGEVIRAMLPGGINLETKTRIRLLASPDQIEEYLKNHQAPRQKNILQHLRQQTSVALVQLRRKFRGAQLYSAIDKLVAEGLISKEVTLADAQTKPKTEPWLKIRPELKSEKKFQNVFDKLQKNAPAQATCLHYIFSKKSVQQKALLKELGTSSATVNTLIAKGYIEKYQREVFRSYFLLDDHQPPPKFTLNEFQTRAIYHISEATSKGEYKTFLVHGVTGSGKTQVYIEALKHIRKLGKTAIVLVPEISLTPQTVRRFAQNFPGQIAVLHSRMSPGERYDFWRKLQSGDLTIAIGARSAIFAPLKNLGLIIVDEEHESSYKQYDSRPLYHARDVAVYRGMLNKAAVILGSATPSLESYYNAKIGKFHLLELPTRIDDVPMPVVKIVNMLQERKQRPGQKVDIFSSALQEKMKEKIKKGEQIILLQNRRGFSTYIKCKDCGHVEKCENCDITLTYHAQGRYLQCHYCHYTKRAPSACPKCGGKDILFRGIGTERVEEEIHKLFPGFKVVRMDLDTTSRKRSHHQILSDFARGKYQILLGTQMVAKGLDFQNVTLVGVISADTSLLLPDFRSTERTFQLLTQVAGRAGRKELLGEVVIQSYSPDNSGLKFAQFHNFKGFFLSELPLRKELNYPPFGRLAYILFSGEEEQRVQDTAVRFFNHLRFPPQYGDIFGPLPSPLSKLKGKFRWQIIVKFNKNRDPGGRILHEQLKNALQSFKAEKRLYRVKIQIDIDPISLL